MSFEITLNCVKLNRRHKGYGSYPYRIEFIGYGMHNRARGYIELRNFLINNYGPSCELELTLDCKSLPKWCWLTNSRDLKYYIYGDEQIMSHIMLVKEKFEKNWNI